MIGSELEFDDPFDPEFDELADAESSRASQYGVTCHFLTGAAGTGKTHATRERQRSAPHGQIILASTTGISAVNLGEGVTTIHTLLKYFDEESLRDRFVTGRLTRAIVDLVQAGMRELVIDEISMFTGESLDMVYQGMLEAAARLQLQLRLTVTGDYMQLPPVKSESWAFDAACWSEFAQNTTRLTKNWRQSEPEFLECLWAARRGDGEAALEHALAAGISFHSALDEQFPGSTLFGRNDQVDRYNLVRLGQVAGRQFLVRSTRWVAACQRKPEGPGEWKNIPEQWPIKIGALVMILANDVPAFTYANGDLGVVKKWNPESRTWTIELLRNGKEVGIGKITRRWEVSKIPDGVEWLRARRVDGVVEPPPWDEAERKSTVRRPYRISGEKRYVVGEVEYYPLRLCYGTSVHKSQGLSLDRVQIDLRNSFVGEPAMAYVALSRCRTAEGLRLVGTPEILKRRVKVHSRAVEWL